MPFMWALWLCRSALTSAAVLLAGTAALRLLARGTGVERSSSWNVLAWTSWSGLLGAAVFQLGLTAADMSGLPLLQACSGQVLGSVLAGTTFGAVWQVRLGLLAATLVNGGCLRAAQREVGRTRLSTVLEVIGTVLTAALLATLVLSGHAHASDKHAWLLPANVAHVVAAGAWPGGLLPMALLLTRAGRQPDIVPATLTVTRRFSRLSLVAVGVLAFSGGLNGYGLVGSFSALWTSTYGRLVLVKMSLFAGMICLGVMNRRLLIPAPPANASGTVRHLWRNVAWECFLATAVLLTTEALSMNAPPPPM